MADIQCVGFFQDLLQGALLITSSYRCGYCPSGISTLNPSESEVRLTSHASRELGRASTGAPEIIASSVKTAAKLLMPSTHAGSKYTSHVPPALRPPRHTRIPASSLARPPSN